MFFKQFLDGFLDNFGHVPVFVMHESFYGGESYNSTATVQHEFENKFRQNSFFHSKYKVAGTLFGLLSE